MENVNIAAIAAAAAVAATITGVGGLGIGAAGVVPDIAGAAPIILVVSAPTFTVTEAMTICGFDNNPRNEIIELIDA